MSRRPSRSAVLFLVLTLTACSEIARSGEGIAIIDLQVMTLVAVILIALLASGILYAVRRPRIIRMDGGRYYFDDGTVLDVEVDGEEVQVRNARGRNVILHKRPRR